MHLLLMILYVDLSLFSNCVFSLNYVMPHSWCNLGVSLPWISMSCCPDRSSIFITCVHCELCSSPVLLFR
jgi:hypothetical protein